jgi:hypothetical protein
MSYNAPANLMINRDLEIAVLYKDNADCNDQWMVKNNQTESNKYDVCSITNFEIILTTQLAIINTTERNR